jgi:hypothetical protein
MADYILTRASARLAGACYSDDRLAELIPPEGLTPEQVAELPIPPDDIHWALIYAMGVPAATLRLHAVWCARRALARIEIPDPRSIAACDVAERYALGQATEEELRAAEAAARAAAWSADSAAADRATSSAAADRATSSAADRSEWFVVNAADRAAASAAWDAAVSPAWSSEAAAVWAAVKAAERAVQVLDLVKRITNND